MMIALTLSHFLKPPCLVHTYSTLDGLAEATRLELTLCNFWLEDLQIQGLRRTDEAADYSR